VQNGTIHEKKAQSFLFAAAQYCGRKKGAWQAIGLSRAHGIFSLFFTSVHFSGLISLFCV